MVCPSCKSSDALVQEGEELQIMNPFRGGLGFHQFVNVKCTKCKRLAIAPFTSGDKRKYNEALTGLCSRKRFCW